MASSSNDERPAVSYPAPVWPWLLLMWAVVVLLFIGPFLEVGNSIGGMTGKMNGSWSQTVDIGRDLLWLVFDVVILLPLAIVVNVVATRNRRRKVVVAQRAAAARNSKKKDR